MAFNGSACSRVAGAYDIAYKDAVTSVFSDLGRTSEDGIVLRVMDSYQTITGDALGPDADVDGFFTGRKVELEFVIVELNKGSQIDDFLYPWRTHIGTTVIGPYEPGNEFTSPTTGQLISEVAGVLKLTPKDNTPAKTWKPGPLYFRGIASGPYESTMSSGQRTIPVMFKAIPFWLTNSAPVYWSYTEPDGDE